MQLNMFVELTGVMTSFASSSAVGRRCPGLTVGKISFGIEPETFEEKIRSYLQLPIP